MQLQNIRRFKLAAVALVVLLFMSIFTITASASGSAEFSIPDGTVDTGTQFQVSITFTADSEIGWAESNLVYDSSALQFVSGDGASGGGGILTIHDFPTDNSQSLTLTLTFIALKDGKSEMSLSNCAIFASDGTLLGSPTAYAYITAAVGTGTTTTTVTTTVPTTTSDETGSETTTTVTTPTTVETGADGYPTKGVLTALTVSEGELVPEFSPDIYNYTVKVDNSVEYLEVEGTKADITDYIWYEGSKYLQVGYNTRTITVTDENGNKKVYTITIERAEAGETVTTTQTAQPSSGEETVSSATETTASTESDTSEASALDNYKKVLMPALGIVMFVLVLALVIVVVWLKKKVSK